MRSHKGFYLFLSLLTAGTLLVAGCDSIGSDGSGRIRVEMTDAPLDDVAEARITIQRVELLSDDGAVITLSDEDMDFNLLELQNGITATLADVEVPEDEYSQIRVLVDEDAKLIFNDGSEEQLKVPSGSQTGIKILFPSFEINDESDLVVLTIDFDVEDSFVDAGASGKFLFKPVIKPEKMEVNGEVEDLDDDE